MQDTDSPFGSWPMDVDMLSFETHELTALLLGVDRQVLSFERDSNAYVVKLWYDALEEADVPRQLRICQLAGDCVVPIVGRAYRHGVLIGYVMRRETPLDLSPTSSKDERVAVIRQVCELVDRLHSRNMVHGDLKRLNIMRCSDGAFRFIDLECMSVVGDGFVAQVATAQYMSQRRSLRPDSDREPLSFSEDYHSLALLIFELYTGRDDFYSIGPTSTEDQIIWTDVCCDAANIGMPPDVRRIDDPMVAQLVMGYFHRGPDRHLTLDSTLLICVQHEMPFCRHAQIFMRLRVLLALRAVPPARRACRSLRMLVFDGTFSSLILVRYQFLSVPGNASTKAAFPARHSPLDLSFWSPSCRETPTSVVDSSQFHRVESRLHTLPTLPPTEQAPTWQDINVLDLPSSFLKLHGGPQQAFVLRGYTLPGERWSMVPSPERHSPSLSALTIER
ncbi:uncharacterized protein SCHCODRAFT_02570047 [Schizophyllum commune H4-8]|uniref:Protein kinase domain-containing protein n=1 Tax=Schizophyllum commune (strain H4-8 / FGSC 9210) TaxID=578458 RepID=D8PXE6_SCHCM|nr:uncharacterized protein SCHCODRAFT_02570047 [Schizophyllum commune H4-8]KAI5896885.1 hypothetical protein SCHCODRAFT_02570047 [Schizophyllum commune H4-8]